MDGRPEAGVGASYRGVAKEGGPLIASKTLTRATSNQFHWPGSYLGRPGNHPTYFALYD